MQLPQLIKRLDDCRVTGIATDSKKVEPGFAFVAVRGARTDGHLFIDEAIQRGAKVIITQGKAGEVRRQKAEDVSWITVRDTRTAVGPLTAHLYGDPSSTVDVIGVTGTNGKTTVTYLIEAILKRAKIEAAVVGTINYRYKGICLPSVNTTPGPIELQGFLRRIRDARVPYAVMEVSSHALDQDRIAGIRFRAALFTNLTQDHLDYHKDMEGYFRAKAKLFTRLPKGAYAVINNDDPYGRRLTRLCRARVVTYGTGRGCDYRAEGIQCRADRTTFTVAHRRRRFLLSTRLIGLHNVQNILTAAAFACEEGVPVPVVQSAIKNFSPVPGRLERIESNKGFSVFVDYAHTDDALTNVITALRALGPRRIIVMFGCGGDRDVSKRPRMGRVATELADYCIITSDNPRSESPQAIIEDIRRGITRDNYCVIPARARAIRSALCRARCGDIVLLAGKGHETYQIVDKKTMHFDDREVTRECLQSMNS